MRQTRSPAYRWVILAVAFLGVFGAIGLGRFGYSTVLPDMQVALDLSGAAAGSLASWNLAGNTLMAFLGGLLASRFGARNTVTTGMVITAVGMLLTGFSTSLAVASSARFVTGLGNGMVMAPSIALMAAWFDTRRLGLASTIVASGNGLGLVVAGPLVPRIIAGGDYGAWRWAWYSFAAITILVSLLTLCLVRNRPHEVSRKMPTETSEKGESFAGLGRVLRSRHAWHLAAVNFLFGFAYLIYFTFFQKRLVADFGLSDSIAGVLFLTVGVASLVFGVPWGAVSDRVGRGRTLAAILTLQAVAACLFGLRSGTAGLVISAIIFGSGVFSAPGLIGAACGDRFGAKLAFVSLGFVTIFIGIGMAVGPYVGGLLEDKYASLGPSYLLSASVFMVGALTALFLRQGTERQGVDAGHREPSTRLALPPKSWED